MRKNRKFLSKYYGAIQIHKCIYHNSREKMNVVPHTIEKISQVVTAVQEVIVEQEQVSRQGWQRYKSTPEDVVYCLVCFGNILTRAWEEFQGEISRGMV